ncbi:hypothetical protein DCC62_29095, partial [candidate division KSB1 bacterium]
QTHTWYFAGGEFRGGTTSSDRGFWAPYMGAGIFKSTDNGETWQLLPSTKDSDPTVFNSAFDYVHRLAISPTTGTVFVANNASGIYRSTDGGNSFPLVLGGVAQHAWSDVAFGSNGVVVATLSHQTQGAAQQTNLPGVYKSHDDGVTWMNITPATFPNTHHRSLLAVAPSNPNIVYVLTFTGQTLSDGREDMRFHKINSATGASEDRSSNLPRYSGAPELGAAIHAWFNFCMVLAVKPDDENFVIAGGTTLFRSRNGFASPPRGARNETHIGGYANPNNGGVYANHYVDQQNLAFHPTRPNQLWSANDGGVFVTRNVTGTPVAWENKNRGYISSQFYAVAISARADDEQIIGGAQERRMTAFSTHCRQKLPWARQRRTYKISSVATARIAILANALLTLLSILARCCGTTIPRLIAPASAVPFSSACRRSTARKAGASFTNTRSIPRMSA